MRVMMMMMMMMISIDRAGSTHSIFRLSPVRGRHTSGSRLYHLSHVCMTHTETTDGTLIPMLLSL